MLTNQQVGALPQSPSTQQQLMQQYLTALQQQQGGTGTASTQGGAYSPWQGAAAMLSALTSPQSVGASSTPAKDIYNTLFGMLDNTSGSSSDNQ
jgi:hypothetical protein